MFHFSKKVANFDTKPDIEIACFLEKSDKNNRHSKNGMSHPGSCKFPRARCFSAQDVFRKKSRSLASAFARGIIETTGNYIGWIDANQGELAPKFNIMIKELEQGNDIVIMSRYIPGGGDERTLLRSIGSKYFNFFARNILRLPIKDLTSSNFLMKKKVLDEVTFLGYGHGEFFLEFLYNAHKKGFKIKEIPYVQKKDEDLENSKSAPNLIRFFYLSFMYILRVFSTIIRRKN